MFGRFGNLMKAAKSGRVGNTVTLIGTVPTRKRCGPVSAVACVW
jgi:hypothetical protein